MLALQLSVTLLSCILVAVRATNSSHCDKPLKRQEWRTLNSSQKSAYIDAVLCLHNLPAITSYEGVKTRFDDFQALHISLTPEIHLVGQFLPWHRRFVNIYEIALRKECGYTGAQPYWNWSMDVDYTNTIVNSPLWDPKTGFGGNGISNASYEGLFGNESFIGGFTGGGCITDGPFAAYNLSLGPGTTVTNHCLRRAFNTIAPKYLNSTQVANTTKQPNFELFRVELEGAPVTPLHKIHDGGHLVVGGEMSNRFSSPGDPVFYLHHANLDRIWWEWQEQQLEKRLKDMSGRTSVDPPYVNVTLEFKIKMGTLAPLVSIGDIMDIRNEPLCYKYV